MPPPAVAVDSLAPRAHGPVARGACIPSRRRHRLPHCRHHRQYRLQCVCAKATSLYRSLRDACSDMPARMIVIALDAAGPTGMESGEIALRAGFGVFAVT